MTKNLHIDESNLNVFEVVVHNKFTNDKQSMSLYIEDRDYADKYNVNSIMDLLMQVPSLKEALEFYLEAHKEPLIN